MSNTFTRKPAPDHVTAAAGTGAQANPEGHRSWQQVRQAELDTINRRPGRQPDDPLVGLAISGGGIRSATFALGVLETLRSRGVLPRIDLLSTVSGGGYIGAWLTGNCFRHASWLTSDSTTGAQWLQSIAHLRRYSNYLSPRVGFFSADTWSMATIWLRNTLLIQTTVILVIATLLMLPRPLFEGFVHWPWAGYLRWTTIFLFIFGIVGIAGNLLRLTSDDQPKILRASSWPTGLAAGAALIGAAWAYGAWMDFNPFDTGEVSYRAAVPIALLLVVGGFFLQPCGVWLVARFQQQDEAATQINYTQGWVQAVVIVPLMISAFLVAAILWGETTGVPTRGGLSQLDSFSTFFTAGWRYWPFPLAVVFASMWLLSFCGIRRITWAGRLALALSPFVAVGVLHGLLCGVMLLLHHWAQLPVKDGALRAFVWGPALVALAFVLTIVVLIGMMGRQSTDAVREWWSRLGAWLGIYATGWMVIAVSAVYGPWAIDAALASHPWTSLTISGGWIATVVGGLLGGSSGATGGGDASKSTTTQLKEAAAAVAPFLFIAGLLIGVAYGLHQAIVLNAGLGWNDVGATARDHFAHAAFLSVSLTVLAGCALALVLMAWRVDINEFSLNAFYRNRLVRCYLGASRFDDRDRVPQNFTGFDQGDDIRLQDLVTTKSPPRGPLHIVNCALNLGGSSDLALHTRHSAIFTLSPLFCGSPYVSRSQSGNGVPLGYVPTNLYGGHSSAPTLGQAISVSGAAASPNMGYHTSPVVAFLLTLFNVRLGWWFPNPARTRTDVASPAFSLRYLFAELFGGATDKSGFVMISDGGHFENLAAYELIRRRCRVVIVSDGECDPKLEFDGLGTLIRMCEVDFDYRIVISVKKIRLKSGDTWSEQRFAVGTIDYGGGEQGTLIYLKASMTGTEDTAVLQYKSSHAAFPHETTGDQFYGEDQFETYRQLGQSVASDAFSRRDEDVLVTANRLRTAEAIDRDRQAAAHESPERADLSHQSGAALS